MNEFIPAPSEDRRVTTTYCGIERRADWHTPEDCHKLLNVQDAMNAVNKRLDDGSARMTRIEDSVQEVNNCIKANNDAALVHRVKFERTLEENTAATKDILDIVNSARGFFRTMGKLGEFFKWGLGILTAFVAFWLTVKNGGK